MPAQLTTEQIKQKARESRDARVERRNSTRQSSQPAKSFKRKSRKQSTKKAEPESESESEEEDKEDSGEESPTDSEVEEERARKKSARKSSARKSSARKSSARKSSARKSSARKSSAKKSDDRYKGAYINDFAELDSDPDSEATLAKRDKARLRRLRKKEKEKMAKNAPAKQSAKKDSATKSKPRGNLAKIERVKGRSRRDGILKNMVREIRFYQKTDKPLCQLRPIHRMLKVKIPDLDPQTQFNKYLYKPSKDKYENIAKRHLKAHTGPNGPIERVQMDAAMCFREALTSYMTKAFEMADMIVRGTGSKRITILPRDLEVVTNILDEYMPSK